MRPASRLIVLFGLLALLCATANAQVSLFSNSTPPGVVATNAGAPFVAGMRFTSDSDGFIIGARFYKDSSDTSVNHVASLWDPSAPDHPLAQATFTNETASGWQQVAFPAPVPITANTVYEVSYYSPAGYYSFTSGFVPGSFNVPLNYPPPLHALNGAQGNGWYAYGNSSTFPNINGWGTNFWVDIVFSTSATPPPPPPPPPPPSPNSHTLFPDSAPQQVGVVGANNGSPLELGVKFYADVSGYVTGVRFYKADSSNIGPHVGSLWDPNAPDHPLAQAAFSNETASGWQQVNFSTPVAITANAMYVVSYNTPGGFSLNLFPGFSLPVDNPPLHAPGYSNGLLAPAPVGPTFPNLVFGVNFWADVMFATPAGGPSLVSIAVSPANASITVGSSQQFHATGMYSDGSSHDITASVSWSSGTPAVAGINSAGFAVGFSVGSTVITATQGTVSGTGTLTVTAAP